MWFELAFFGNPFNNQQYSRPRKLLFAYDQLSRLTALDPEAFGPQISATQAAADSLSKAAGSTGAATGTQRGTTTGTDAQLKAYRKVVGGKYNVLLDHFGGDKSAELLITLFGDSVQRYTRDLTKTNAKERMDELDKLLTANKTAVGADIVKAIGDAANAYLGKRKTQTDNKGKTSAAQLTEGTQETVLNQVLWLNMGAIVAQYPAPEQEPSRRAAADFSLLLRRSVGPQPTTETGPLAPHSLVNLVDDGLKPSTKLKLHNPGPAVLHFALSATIDSFPSTGYQPLKPGETLTLTAADLGDVALLPNLNAQNDTDLAGSYEITIG
jgi:hypothetical protein